MIFPSIWFLMFFDIHIKFSMYILIQAYNFQPHCKNFWFCHCEFSHKHNYNIILIAFILYHSFYIMSIVFCDFVLLVIFQHSKNYKVNLINQINFLIHYISLTISVAIFKHSFNIKLLSSFKVLISQASPTSVSSEYKN